MITIGCFYISAKYNKSDYKGYVYYGTVLVDLVGMLFTSCLLSGL